MKRYTFRGELVLTRALHIGSGGGGLLAEGSQDTDATVVRDSHGRAYIPGSSLRGALRADIARLAPVLDLGAIRDEGEIRASCEPAMKLAGQEAAARKLPAETLLQKKLNDGVTLTPAERLFGTLYWASPLHIPDLPELYGRAVPGEIRHGVGIDRDTGAAHDGAKYDFEALPRDTRFDFRMWCEIPPEPAGLAAAWLKLLALGLRRLERGEIPLGGRLARGVGQVQLDRLAVYMLDMSDKQALFRALTASDEPARLGEAQSGWTTAALQGAP